MTKREARSKAYGHLGEDEDGNQVYFWVHSTVAAQPGQYVAYWAPNPQDLKGTGARLDSVTPLICYAPLHFWALCEYPASAMYEGLTDSAPSVEQGLVPVFDAVELDCDIEGELKLTEPKNRLGYSSLGETDFWYQYAWRMHALDERFILQCNSFPSFQLPETKTFLQSLAERRVELFLEECTRLNEEDNWRDFHENKIRETAQQSRPAVPVRERFFGDCSCKRCRREKMRTAHSALDQSQRY